MAKISRIELLKQKLQEEKQRKADGGGGKYNSDVYPFWAMEIGQSARVRILPDKNEDNPYMFYVDRLEHKISVNGEDKKIPCRSMHGEECPICDLSRKYYKDEGKGSKNGKYYYRSKTSIVRVLVVEDPLPPNSETGESYEGKVLNTQFGYQLMEKIKEQISSDDLGDFTDFEEGYDFIIKKTAQGEYGTYAVGSGFARRPTAIPEDIRENIELIDLSTLLPQDIGYEKVQNLLQAHISGASYEGEEEEAPKPAVKATKATKAVVEEDDEDEDDTPPFKKSAPAAAKSDEDEDEDDDDIMERLRKRRSAAKK